VFVWRGLHRTVHIDGALLHELAELGEPVGGIDFVHVDGVSDRRRMEKPGEDGGGATSYIGSGCRACAAPEAGEQHEYYRG